MLDLSNFEKALSQIRTSLGYAHSPDAKKNVDLFRQFRAASIQAFEYSYEIAIKFMYRVLETYYPSVSAGLDAASFREILRLLLERELIRDDKCWLSFREKRNITSHTYDEGSAVDVFASIPSFLEESDYFLTRIKILHERNA